MIGQFALLPPAVSGTGEHNGRADRVADAVRRDAFVVDQGDGAVAAQGDGGAELVRLLAAQEGVAIVGCAQLALLLPGAA